MKRRDAARGRAGAGFHPQTDTGGGRRWSDDACFSSFNLPLHLSLHFFSLHPSNLSLSSLYTSLYRYLTPLNASIPTSALRAAALTAKTTPTPEPGAAAAAQSGAATRHPTRGAGGVVNTSNAACVTLARAAAASRTGVRGRGRTAATAERAKDRMDTPSAPSAAARPNSHRRAPLGAP